MLSPGLAPRSSAWRILHDARRGLVASQLGSALALRIAGALLILVPSVAIVWLSANRFQEKLG